MRTITFLLAVMFSVTACSQKNTITEERQVGSYNQLDISGIYHIVLTDGTVGNLTIKAPENFMENIVTKVDDNVLKIKNEGSFSLRRSTITIYVPVDSSLRKIKVNGTASVQAEKELQADALEVKVNGTGSVKGAVNTRLLSMHIAGAGSANLSGNTEILDVQVNGTGSVDADNLKAVNAALDISGAGSIDVYVSGELEAVVRGVGSIKVEGNPRVRKQEIKGVGSIKVR